MACGVLAPRGQPAGHGGPVFPETGVVYVPGCPLLAQPVPAGFPSPATDYVETRLSLDEHLVEHEEATFFVRVQGNSMVGFGINDGDLLVVDRSRQPGVAPAKQQIMSSRSFGNYVYGLEPLKEAVASYVAIAAEKLRGQGSVAGMIQVYVRTNPHKENVQQYSKGLTIPLPEATDDTLRLTQAALWGLKRIYRPGYAYQKAGIMLMNLMDSANQQASLFGTHRNNERLMAVMDRVNAIWGRGTLRSAATGVEKSWSMRREKMSPLYTTHWEHLPIAV
jgi:hypothetical protein